MKWPRWKIRRQDLERVVIACSAVLVLALSVTGRNTQTEMYEEPFDEIPAEQTVSTGQTVPMQQTVVYYEDGDGYLVPVQKEVVRQDGIAKATLSMMVQSPGNDMEAARLGLVPVVPEGTTFDLDIAKGHARVDLSRHVLDAVDKEQEENVRTAIVWALTEFDTVKDVSFLVDGQKREELTHGTNISGSYTRVGLNREEETAETFAGGSEIQVFFPASDGRLLVPVSRTVYSNNDVETAVFEFLRGPERDSGLETPLPEGTRLLGVSIRDGVVTIDFSKAFSEITQSGDGGVQAMRALMMTCRRFPGVKSVKVLVDGEPFEMPVGEVPTFANVAEEVAGMYPEVMMIE